MIFLRDFFKYYHTVRYLKPIQIYGRIWFHLRHPKPILEPLPPLRSFIGTWCTPIPKTQSLIDPRRFRFLNEEHEISSTLDWNNPAWPKLWLYNLHYFNDLNAVNVSQRNEWHYKLLTRWIRENPSTIGNGWESYPLSLRIVNWIKWALAGNSLPEPVVNSLATQIRYLRKRLEYHILANHLFANAKALIFGGLFFAGKEATSWLRKGLRIVQKEIEEQISSDGGHFELSPMYHSVFNEDLLDILNIIQAYPDALKGEHEKFVKSISGKAQLMLQWLMVMCHPDGRIALFNDSAFGIAPTLKELKQYNNRLGLQAINGIPMGLTSLPQSGYVRIQHGSLFLIIDAGNVGPNYQPGHAHADTLSFELSLGKDRTIVDTGTFNYEDSNERQYQRSTMAHNTVSIDNQDSTEVWSRHRVARRAKIVEFKTECTDDREFVRASHDGFSRFRGMGIHCRTWEVSDNVLTITDVIEGHGKHSVCAAFHFHPDAVLEAESSHCMYASCNDGKNSLKVELDGLMEVEICSSVFYPEFGLSVPNKVITCKANVDLPFRFVSKFVCRKN